MRVSPPDDAVRSVVLVLHGGQVRGTTPTRWRQLSVLRMLPVARALHAAGRRQGTAVWRLKFRVRGWNGDAADPLLDLQWALTEVRRRHGDVPVLLVGHSMGGRTALQGAGDQSVVAVVALAPWVVVDQPVAPLAGRRVLVAHGSDDTVTDPAASLDLAQRAVPVAAGVRYLRVAHDGHAMLRRPRLWHRIAVEGLVDLADQSDGTAASKCSREPPDDRVGLVV